MKKKNIENEPILSWPLNIEQMTNQQTINLTLSRSKEFKKMVRYANNYLQLETWV